MALPRFDGRRVNDQRFIFTGSHLVPEGEHQAHKVGEEGYSIVHWRVLSVNHKDKDGSLTRIETTTIPAHGHLPDDEGATLLEKYGQFYEPDPAQGSLLDDGEDED